MFLPKLVVDKIPATFYNQIRPLPDQRVAVHFIEKERSFMKKTVMRARRVHAA